MGIQLLLVEDNRIDQMAFERFVLRETARLCVHDCQLNHRVSRNHPGGTL